MHLPGPLRAAVGLVVTAAGEVRTLPDRAVELPMLAVSRALQVSLRAQQRYAQLAARGDEVLNPRSTGEEPPAWATFDDPLPTDDPHRDAVARLDEFVTSFEAASRSGDDEVAARSGDRGPRLTDIFGETDPDPGGTTADAAAEAAAEDSGASSERANDDAATVTPIGDAPSAAGAAGAAGADGPRGPARKASRKSARKAPVKRAPAKKAAATQAPADPASGGSGNPGKSVSKPRHIAPSKFDDAADD